MRSGRNEPISRVRLTVERFHHSDEVAGGGDGGANPLAKRLAVGAYAKVFVAAGSGRLEDDLDLAGVALKFDHWFALRVEVAEVERPTVDALRVQGVERYAEPAEALLVQGRREIQATRGFV